MSEETRQAVRKLRPSIEEVLEAARRGVILDWSDNPDLYSATLDLLYPELAERPMPRAKESSRHKKSAS
jgi:hypothetical protein